MTDNGTCEKEMPMGQWTVGKTAGDIWEGRGRLQ